MKRSYVFLVVTALAIALTIVWLVNSEMPMALQDVVPWTILLLILGLGFYMGFSKLVRREKRGEPPEDEFSKKILQKASSLSFYISVYLWIALMYFGERLKLETHMMIGIGILSMTLVFAICWLVYKLGGIKDA